MSPIATAPRTRKTCLASVRREEMKRNILKPFSFIPHPRFSRASQMKEVLQPVPSVKSDERLCAEDERKLFLQLNYFRYKREKIRRTILRNKVWDAQKAKEFQEWDLRQKELRDKLVAQNMGLVPAMARFANHSHVDFEDLVSEGNMALMQAVDRFDPSRGYRFSTYACRAILRSMSRYSKKQYRYYQRFPVSLEPSFEKDDRQERRRFDQIQDQAHTVRMLLGNQDTDLSETEAAVLSMRFPFTEHQRPAMKLNEIGEKLELSKERVRQIQNNALEKIRQMVNQIA